MSVYDNPDALPDGKISSLECGGSTPLFFGAA
jgi:hypothetical protein